MNLNFPIDKMNHYLMAATSKETFDNTIGPFAENIGLPFFRSSCYAAAAFLGVKKIVLGVGAIGLKIIPCSKSLENKASAAFKRRLFRDLTLIAGLIGIGLFVEAIESDLKIYSQELQIKDKPLSLLFNGNFTEFFTKLSSALLEDNNSRTNEKPDVPFKSILSKEHLDILKKYTETALHSMKGMRFTPLATHSIIEINYGLPLRRFGFTSDPELSLVTKAVESFNAMNFTKISEDISNCLSEENRAECFNEKKNQIMTTLDLARNATLQCYDSTIKYMESPLENTERYIVDYISTAVNSTLASKYYLNLQPYLTK